ncbi:hypothetical protein WA158_003006 [Blastocystis sp. Blastoise]
MSYQIVLKYGKKKTCNAMGTCLLCGKEIKCNNNGSLQSSSIENHLMFLHNMEKGIFRKYGTINNFFNGFQAESLLNKHKESILMYCKKLNSDIESTDEEIVYLGCERSPKRRQIETLSTPICSDNNTELRSLDDSTQSLYSSNLSISRSSSSYTKAEALRLLFMCQNRLSFQIMEKPNASDYLDLLSYRRATKILSSVSCDLFKLFQSKLESALHYCLSSDIWSRHNRKIISWNYYYYDISGYHSGLYALLPIDASDSESILKSLKSIISHHSPIAVTTDRGTGYTSALSGSNSSILKIDCFSHFLNTLYTHGISKKSTKSLFECIRSLIREIRKKSNFECFSNCIESITGSKPIKPTLDCPTRFYSILQPLEWIYKYGTYAVLFLNHLKKKKAYDISIITEFVAFIPYMFALNKSHLILSCFSYPTAHLVLPFISSLKNIFDQNPSDYLGYETKPLVCINEFVNSIRNDLNKIGKPNFYYNKKQLDFLACSSSMYIYLDKLLESNCYNDVDDSFYNRDIKEWKSIFITYLSKECPNDKKEIVNIIDSLSNGCRGIGTIPSISKILSCSIERRDSEYIGLIKEAIDCFFMYDIANHKDFMIMYKKSTLFSISITNNELGGVGNKYLNKAIIDGTVLNDSNENSCNEYYEESDSMCDYLKCSLISSSEESCDEFVNNKCSSTNDSCYLFSISKNSIFETEKTFSVHSDLMNYYSFELYFNKNFYNSKLIFYLSKFLSPSATEIGDERIFNYCGLLDNGKNTNMKTEKFCNIVYVNKNFESVQMLTKNKKK